jgi:hypothetical protein
MIRIQEEGFSETGGDWIDDVSVVGVPEPGSLGLLATGLDKPGAAR